MEFKIDIFRLGKSWNRAYVMESRENSLKIFLKCLFLDLCTFFGLCTL